MDKTPEIIDHCLSYIKIYSAKHWKRSNMKLKTMTVREFQEILEREVFPYPDAQIIFGSGDLHYYRIKGRKYNHENNMPELLQIEFSEIYSVTG